jgi:hypothetical protein
MALKKAFGSSIGVNIEYWKISMVIYDYLNDVTRVILSGYISEEARANSSSPFTTKDYYIKTTTEVESINTITQETSTVTDEQGVETTVTEDIVTVTQIPLIFINNIKTRNPSDIKPTDRSEIYNILKLFPDWCGAEDL